MSTEDCVKTGSVQSSSSSVARSREIKMAENKENKNGQMLERSCFIMSNYAVFPSVKNSSPKKGLAGAKSSSHR